MSPWLRGEHALATYQDGSSRCISLLQYTLPTTRWPPAVLGQALDGYYRVLSTLNTLPVTSNRVLGEGRRVVVRSQGSLLAAP